MTFNRRRFLSKLSTISGTIGAGALFTPALAKNLHEAFEQIDRLTLEDSIKDETFWHQIKSAYTVSSTMLNLNNGGVSPQPKVVQDALIRNYQMSNETPTYFMWRLLDKGRDTIRAKLAALAGCDKEEIAINRNTSEALETVIFGLRLKAGDEVILSKQDYPNMINAWKQRAHRDGIILNWIDMDLPMANEAIIQMYSKAFTKNTKVLHLTHVINWTGQILPVKEIIAAAYKQGIEVVLDAAHSFAHFEFNISELNCDYLGTSLHKWLGAPFGTGMLYVKKEKIKNLYPLLAAPEPESENIRKFEHLGTRCGATEQAIGQAIDFNLMIGIKRKQKRLHYLKEYWTDKVRGFPGLKILTPTDASSSCGICLCHLDKSDPKKLATKIERTYRIHVSGLEWNRLKGIRITPNVYTLTSDLDRWVEALQELTTE